jgi:hypothetical protein
MRGRDRRCPQGAGVVHSHLLRPGAATSVQVTTSPVSRTWRFVHVRWSRPPLIALICFSAAKHAQIGSDCRSTRGSRTSSSVGLVIVVVAGNTLH